jgi:hypothetical protein
MSIDTGYGVATRFNKFDIINHINISLTERENSSKEIGKIRFDHAYYPRYNMYLPIESPLMKEYADDIGNKKVVKKVLEKRGLPEELWSIIRSFTGQFRDSFSNKKCP